MTGLSSTETGYSEKTLPLYSFCIEFLLGGKYAFVKKP
jgi:hypothetical protein